MESYTLSELSKLTNLTKFTIRKILSDKMIKPLRDEEEICFSEEALKTLFLHIAGDAPLERFSIFDEPGDEALRRQILTYHMSDVLTDRERARFLNLPPGCRIREGAKILAPDNLRCGQNVWIGEGAILDAQGGLEIGDNTQVGLCVMIWSHTSHKQAISGNTGSTARDGIEFKPTKIGKNVFIGGPSVVSPGVTIGNGVIISPLTFVSRNVPANTVVSPHRELRTLQHRIDRLERTLANITSALDRLIPNPVE